MTHHASRSATPPFDTNGFLRAVGAHDARGTILRRALDHLDARRARITRRLDGRLVLLAGTEGGDDADLLAWHGAAAGSDAGPVVHGTATTVELRERGHVVAGLTVEARGPWTERDLADLEVFAAVVSDRLTERSRVLEAELARVLIDIGEGADAVAGAAEAALGVLVPRLGAATGVIVETGAAIARVLASHGHGPADRARLQDLRIPFGEGVAWRACIDGVATTTSVARATHLGAHPREGMLVAHPLERMGIARHALLLSYPRGGEPTAADDALVAGLAPMLSNLLAATRERELHDRIRAFQYRALTQHFDDLLQEVLMMAVEVVPGAQAGSLLVREASDGRFAYRAKHGFDVGETRPVRFTEGEMRDWYGRGDPGAGAREPRLLTRSDVDFTRHALQTGASKEWAERTQLDRLRANVCVPIVDGGAVIAYLNLDNLRWEGAFGADSLLTIERYAPAATALLLGALRREQVRLEANTDPLTGLLNRRGFEVRYEDLVARADRDGTAFTLLVMDLHGFKRVNDALGHEAGDRALRSVARALAHGARKGDVVARWGGDEFVALLPDTGVEEAAVVVRRLERAIEEVAFEGDPIGIDIGAASYPADAPDPGALMQVADGRMYEAKRERRGDTAG